MNLLLTEPEAKAIVDLLERRTADIRSHPDAGFVSNRLADRYDELVDRITAAKVRKNGTLSVNYLDRDDARRLETALAHSGDPRFASVLLRISGARLPKADPRRPNGRRAPQEVG